MRCLLPAALLVCIMGCGNPATPSNPNATTSLIGIVTDHTGAPVANAFVRATRLPPSGAGRTDANGRYQLDGIPVGATDVQVSTSGQYRDAQASINLTAPGPNVLNFTLELPSLITLRGTVTDADTGVGIAGATVFIATTLNGPPANAGLSAVTSNDGSYAIPNVFAGNSNVWATAAGYQDRAIGWHGTEPLPLNFQLRRVR